MTYPQTAPVAADPTSLTYLASTPVRVARRQWSETLTAGSELVGINQHVQGAVGDVEPDPVAVAQEGDRPAVDSLGCDVPDAQAGGAAGEPAVGQQQHVLAQAGALDRTGDGEHFPHPGTALGAFVADHHGVTAR